MDQPAVEQSKENLSSNQWGRGFLFKRDGKKRTIIPKRFFWLITVLFTVICISMFFQQTDVVLIIGRSSLIGGAEILPASSDPSVTVARIQEEKASKNSKIGKKVQKYSGPQLIVRRRAGQIPPGLLAKAVLKSGASNGLVRAELSDDLSFNGETILEVGSVLVGQGSSTEDRLYIRFDQMVTKDGTIESVHAQACDLSDKIVGLKGSKLGQRAAKVAASIGLGFIGGLATGLQDSKGENGVLVHEASLKNALLNGTANAALETSREMISNVKDQQPVITVKESTEICVLFEGT